MIVIDSSAMVEALVGREVDDSLFDALTGEVSAPHVLDIEVLSALRGLLLGSKIDKPTAEHARRDYFDLAVIRHEVAPLATRIWQLRHQFTSYDASYLALAEALDVPLYTCDGKLDSDSHHAQVGVFRTAD